MDSDKYDLAMIYGMGLATFFWIVVMLMSVGVVYDHGKYIGKLESLVPAESQNRSSENEN